MSISITATGQLIKVADIPTNKKLELQIGVWGTFDGTVEVRITRPGEAARTIDAYSAPTDPDDIITIIGPCVVHVGAPTGGSFISGTANVDVQGKFV